MIDLVKLGVACIFGAATMEEIEEWINSTAATDPDLDPSIFDIFSRDVRVSRSRFTSHFHKIRPHFKIDSDEGIRACKAVLKAQIERLHKKEITPYYFCRFICELESYYMDKGESIGGFVAYPDFIGDLWNACDWCDESWSIDTQDYLRNESESVAESLTNA